MTQTKQAVRHLLLTLTIPTFASAHTDPDLFTPTAFIEPPEVVDCTLEDGTET